MTAKNTSFSKKKTLNCRGKLVVLDEPLIMGILNVTPDSFFDGGRYLSEKQLLIFTEKMLSEGAAIIDTGGYSTRPGASDVDEEEEIRRLIPAIGLIVKNFPDAIISADTFRSNVATLAVQAGAAIINDISGGTMDEKMDDVIAKLNVPYILTHIQGAPDDMQENPHYDDVVKEIMLFFARRLERLRVLGVNDIIIDPGFGFGKTLEHNFKLLQNLDSFRIFELPILAGISRKSMVNRILGTRPDKALNGTTVLNTIALLNGANILRVHDVKEAREAVKLVGCYKTA